MKKLVLLVVLLAMAAIPSVAQIPGYMVTSYSNNAGPGGAADQQIRLINYGALGTPLTSPVGDICANIYVFDANQEMVACCACRITPNGLRTISVANNLTNNPVTSVVPVNGDIKIVSSVAPTVCDPTTINGETNPFPNSVTNSLVGFSTHLQTSGGTASGTFLTETLIPNPSLSGDEGVFLKRTCQFARYLGSGKGVCTCGSGS